MFFPSNMSFLSLPPPLPWLASFPFPPTKCSSIKNYGVKLWNKDNNKNNNNKKKIYICALFLIPSRLPLPPQRIGVRVRWRGGYDSHGKQPLMPCAGACVASGLRTALPGRSSSRPGTWAHHTVRVLLKHKILALYHHKISKTGKELYVFAGSVIRTLTNLHPMQSITFSWP